MLELKEKIDGFKAKMSTMERGSVQYEQYRNFINELEAELHKHTKLKVHIEPEVCESCT